MPALLEVIYCIPYGPNEAELSHRLASSSGQVFFLGNQQNDRNQEENQEDKADESIHPTEREAEGCGENATERNENFRDSRKRFSTAEPQPTRRKIISALAPHRAGRIQELTVRAFYWVANRSNVTELSHRRREHLEAMLQSFGGGARSRGAADWLNFPSGEIVAAIAPHRSGWIEQLAIRAFHTGVRLSFLWGWRR